MSFGHPWAFALLALVLLRIVGAIGSIRGAGAFLFPSLSLVGHRRSFRVLTSALPLIVETLGLLALVIALARPQQVVSLTNERFGIDLVIALDGSGSMAAEDFPKSRFETAKELISNFIGRRENDRVGIVTFGQRAATRVPITFDRDIARRVLEKARIGENGDATAIGHAIATSVNRLRSSTSRSRVIILLTDGVNNAGSVEPITAAAIAARLGIKIYTIGIGTRGVTVAPVQVQDPLTGEIRVERVPIRADLDEKMLSAIASSTGGAYFRATDRNAMEAILEQIDKLEKSRLSAPKRETVREFYTIPLTWALLLLTFAYLTGETVWMRLPA